MVRKKKVEYIFNEWKQNNWFLALSLIIYTILIYRIDMTDAILAALVMITLAWTATLSKKRQIRRKR